MNLLNLIHEHLSRDNALILLLMVFAAWLWVSVKLWQLLKPTKRYRFIPPKRQPTGNIQIIQIKGAQSWN